MVATREGELPRLASLAERGRANGLAVREIGPDGIAEIEPAVRGIRALHIPESGVIDYRLVAAAYADAVRQDGGQVRLGHGVRGLARTTAGGWLADTDGGPVRARAVIGCAGLQADRIAAMTGHGSGEYRIVPFRGDYYTFRPAAAGLVRGLVYPVPDPAFPFLGVHFTRGIDGTLHAGPNAVPALAREGYGRLSVNGRDLLDSLRFPGLRKLARAYARTGALEIYRDLVKPAYLAEMRRYIPQIAAHDIRFGPSGIRAQCLSRSGALVDDFLIEEGAGVIHVLNAPSPAATASLVIGQHIADRAHQSMCRPGGTTPRTPRSPLRAERRQAAATRGRRPHRSRSPLRAEPRLAPRTPTCTTARVTGSVLRLRQACLVPFCTTVSPARSWVSCPSSSSSQTWPASTTM